MLRERRLSRLVGRLEAALGKRVRVLRDEAPPPSAIDSFQLDGRHRLSVAGGLTEQEKALICLFLGEWRQNRVQEPDWGTFGHPGEVAETDGGSWGTPSSPTVGGGAVPKGTGPLFWLFIPLSRGKG